jgi:hypothetical protein
LSYAGNERWVFDALEARLNAAAERDGCVEMTAPMVYLEGIAGWSARRSGPGQTSNRTVQHRRIAVRDQLREGGVINQKAPFGESSSSPDRQANSATADGHASGWSLNALLMSIALWLWLPAEMTIGGTPLSVDQL